MYMLDLRRNNSTNGNNGNHREATNTNILANNNSRAACRTTIRPLMPDFLETRPRGQKGEQEQSETLRTILGSTNH